MSVLLVIVLLASEAAPAEETSTARVCFVRHEDSGKMNAVPVRIYGFRAEREQLLTTLAGGAEACVDIEPGDWSFEARSNGAQARATGKAKACQSNPFMTGAVAGTTTTIEVSPKGKAANACGWRLRREEDAHAGVESVRPSRRRGR